MHKEPHSANNTIRAPIERDHRLPPGHPKPQPTACWPQENIALYERYRDWLLEGGANEGASKTIYLPVAGHVLGLNLKPHHELDLEVDFQCTLEYVIAKGSGKDWIKASRNGLNKFKRFMRWERGLGEENKETPFDSTCAASGLPLWLVHELERYQHLHTTQLAGGKIAKQHPPFLVWVLADVEILCGTEKHSRTQRPQTPARVGLCGSQIRQRLCRDRRE